MNVGNFHEFVEQKIKRFDEIMIDLDKKIADLDEKLDMIRGMKDENQSDVINYFDMFKRIRLGF